MRNDFVLNKLISIFSIVPVVRAGVFGSYARYEETEESDIDLVVEIDLAREEHDYVYILWDLLEMETNKTIDLLTTNSLENIPSEIVKNRIKQELRWIYEV